MYRPRRLKRLIIGVVLISTFLFILHYSNRGASDGDAEVGEDGEFLVKTIGCSIPNLDPFDPSIRHLVSAGQPFTCEGSPPMTYMDGDVLRINRTQLLVYDTQLDSCLFEEIHRVDGSDNDFQYTNETWFVQDVKVTGEFLRVVCYDMRGGTLATDFHTRMIRKTPKDKPTYPTKTEKSRMKLNLLIVGMDSVSRLNFMRQMPKTRNYLKDHLQTIELYGFNKIADNTFVNLVPMFSGKYVADLPYDESYSGIPFDEFPFFWKNFSARGYKTLFAEDAPYISIFNYAKAGFDKAPTDYYLRPMSLAIEEHASVWSHDRNCINNKLETNTVLDYIQSFLDLYQEESHMAFSFLTRLTHDDLQRAATADAAYLEFFKNVHQGGYLQNTVTIFFSDHGIRFGTLRETYMGKLEERLPLMMIAFPPWFYAKYPTLYRNLRTNANRITTFFDIYETLMDLLRFDGSPDEHSFSKFGISLFREIPTSRTCVSAGIEPHWCSCYFRSKADISQVAVVAAGREIIDAINQRLQEYSDVCTKLTLAKVTDAILMQPEEASLQDTIKHLGEIDDPSALREGESNTYLLTVEANEGGGRFEATVRHNVDAQTYSVLGDISRVNRYDDQSYCINRHSLKRYCYCD